MEIPLPPVAERFESLEDTLRLAQQMWQGDSSPFHGRRHHLEQPVGSPLPLSRPHPPILIGGMGERKTLKLVARYGDACNLFDIPDGGKTIAHKLEVLKRHCDDAGRAYDEIAKTVSTRLTPGESADEFAQRCDALQQLGLDHAVVITPAPWTEDAVSVLAQAQQR
jgi:alkanesulfonate monooxygenase SsuD/methylene tetrahydromethanopterin reductase-like flavin-dependent oxidoreductase (luciferase family)